MVRYLWQTVRCRAGEEWTAVALPVGGAPVSAKELPMILKRIAKWGTAGVLALGTIPALAFAKTHVSLPTSNITVTPTSAMEAPAARTSSRVTHAKSAQVAKASTKHRVSKHHKATASHHGKASKAAGMHRKTAAAKKKTVSSKTHKASKHKVVRLG